MNGVHEHVVLFAQVTCYPGKTTSELYMNKHIHAYKNT